MSSITETPVPEEVLAWQEQLEEQTPEPPTPCRVDPSRRFDHCISLEEHDAQHEALFACGTWMSYCSRAWETIVLASTVHPVYYCEEHKVMTTMVLSREIR